MGQRPGEFSYKLNVLCDKAELTIHIYKYPAKTVMNP